MSIERICALRHLVQTLAFLIFFSKPVWSQFGGSRVQPSAGGSVGCPERNGRFPVPSQCDAYVECVDGVGEQKLCPEGLLFNSKSPFFGYPCQYPAEVDCEGRSGLQPPQPSEDCPHQFGYYKEGDVQNCGQFRICVNGRGYVFDCPEGLAFNEYTLRCDWPDQVDSCNAEAFLGFTCPNAGSQDTAYSSDGYQFFRSPSNCQKYFLCIKGRPRLFSCGEGKAFNELISGCDGVENVTGCSYSSDRQFGSTPPRQFNSPPQNSFSRTTPRPQFRPQRHDEDNSLKNTYDPFVPSKTGPERVDLFSNNLLQNDFRLR